MTAITVTEFSLEELPTTVISGTPVRRGRVYLRFTSATTGETLDLSSINAAIADIEGIPYETDDGVSVNTAGTASTWSTVTLTSNTAGVEEMCIMVTLT